MKEFLSTIISQLASGQRQTLQQFLQDAASRRVPVDADSIERALDGAGDLIEQPAVDPTEPEGYNAAVRTLLANMAGEYREVDLVESVQDALADLNEVELDRIEVATRDLATILAATRSANRANVEYSDVLFETFGADVNRETDREWYKPIPILALSGQVESFLPLAIDPDDRSLKLARGGDFSRSTNAQGQPLAHVEVEELLGLSIDPTHAVGQAVDGKFFTYWRELVLSPVPIHADPLQVPWLPGSYNGGAACRVHFRFPFAVPFSEILLRPFARYPVQVNQVVWNNRKTAIQELVLDGEFASGATTWSSGGATWTVVGYPTGVGVDGGTAAQVDAVSGRTLLTSTTFTVSGSEFAYQFTYWLRRTRDIRTQVLLNWYDVSGGVVRSDWLQPEAPRDEWTEWSKLVIAPSGIVSGYTGQLVLVADGSGTVFYDKVSFSRTAGMENVNFQVDLESDSLTVPVGNAAGTDLWLVITQPHHEFLQVALPEGDLDSRARWEEIQLQAEAKADTVLTNAKSFWTLQEGRPGTLPERLKENGTQLVREVMRLAGRAREMLVGLSRFADPSPTTHRFSGYLYILGAWEIEVRHREYAPQGLYVSKPYRPRGEVREAILLTNPELGSAEMDPRIKFWLTARAEDRTDKAKLFDGRATFASATEPAARQAQTHFTLTPITLREEHPGTDRLRRVNLNHAPYVDRTRIWTIQAALTSGAIDRPVPYDPNRDTIHQLAGGAVRSITGYRPLQVSLEFADGTIVRPDIIGNRQRGDIGEAGPEVLATATVEQSRTFTTDSQAGSLSFIGLTDQVQQSSSRQRTQTAGSQAYQTRFNKIVSGPNGVAFSLYWHKRNDDLAAGTILTSGDVLVSPARYTVDTESGVIVVRDTPPGGNAAYDSFVAYYHYELGENGSREAFDSRSSLPASGIDFAGTLSQTYPVTRNVTDYVRGDVSRLKAVNLDDLDTEYYPVYEYIQDERGRLVFSENLGPGADRPAKVIVEYESLMIEPRLIVEVRQAGLNDFSSSTPVLHDFTLLLQARR